MATRIADIEAETQANGMPAVTAAEDARRRLLEGMPVTERRLELAGVTTAILEGGEGPPLVLLHGPGEFAGKWLRALPALVAGHRVVAPDLPDHGASFSRRPPLDTERMLAWVDELITECCDSPPALVGHVLGGAIATRYAIRHSDRLRALVLVDTLGLARFIPQPRFGLTMIRFLRKPNERTYDRFMRQCSLDLDGLRAAMGERWDPWVSYTLQGARSPRAKAVGAMMRELGVPRIPPAELARITAPTSLIWGRQDRANRLRVAERASARFGWPLQVIEECADDPARDRPQEFVRALDHLLHPAAVA